jgi:hypothetical protein
MSIHAGVTQWAPLFALLGLYGCIAHTRQPSTIPSSNFLVSKKRAMSRLTVTDLSCHHGSYSTYTAPLRCAFVSTRHATPAPASTLLNPVRNFRNGRFYWDGSTLTHIFFGLVASPRTETVSPFRKPTKLATSLLY